MTASAPPATGTLVPGLPQVVVEGPADYFHTVVRLIDLIRHTQTGGAVLENIASGSMIRIEPEPEPAACDPESDSFVNHRCEVLAAAAVIKFSPHFALPARRRPKPCREVWMEGDEVLLHEFVHAMRTTHKARDCGRLQGNLKVYDSREEFFAILIENIYRSERKLGKALTGNLEHPVPLRRDHELGRMVVGEAKGFNKDTRKLELIFILWNDRRMEPMCRKIAAVQTAFNPIGWARATKPLQAMRSIADAPPMPRI